MRMITVKGTGSVSVSPDMVEITISLSAIDKDYEKAMALSADQINDIREAIQRADLDKKELKTTYFNVSPKYNSVKDNRGNYQSRFEGFEVYHNLKVEFDFTMKRLNEVLVALSTCHSEPKFNIRFTVKNKEAVSESLLASAVANARHKAEILASASGVKLKELLDINYYWGDIKLYSDTEYNVKECCVMMEEVQAYDIEPDDIDLTDSATFVWAIE